MTSVQGRIHTGFHRFTEIGQIFHNKHIFNNNNYNRTFKDGLDKCFLFQFPGIKQKPGKGNFRDLKSQNITGGACPRAPLEACSLGPSFRKSVSIYPRSAPGVCHHGVVTLDRKVSVKRRKEWTDCLAVVSCSHSYRCSNLC